MSDLTLDATINKCQSREAARKHRTGITAQGEAVAALRKSQTPHPAPQATCPGCGAIRHKGGRVQCPAYDQKCVMPKNWALCKSMQK